MHSSPSQLDHGPKTLGGVLRWGRTGLAVVRTDHEVTDVTEQHESTPSKTGRKQPFASPHEAVGAQPLLTGVPEGLSFSVITRGGRALGDGAAPPPIRITTATWFWPDKLSSRPSRTLITNFFFGHSSVVSEPLCRGFCPPSPSCTGEFATVPPVLVFSWKQIGEGEMVRLEGDARPSLPTGPKGRAKHNRRPGTPAATCADASCDDLMSRLRSGDDRAAVFNRCASQLIALSRGQLDTWMRPKVDPEDIVQSLPQLLRWLPLSGKSGNEANLARKMAPGGRNRPPQSLVPCVMGTQTSRALRASGPTHRSSFGWHVRAQRVLP
jgi:hypothetical protein